MNVLHDIPVGSNPPSFVTGVVEISKGSRSKYEVDKVTGLLKLDRILYSPMVYPANYGFIPRTHCDDGDPLDIIVICREAIVPFCMVDTKVIGAMKMIDNGEKDDKILAVVQDDSSLSNVHDISDLPSNFTAELQHFFEEYKRLEKEKKVTVNGFFSKRKAENIVLESIDAYKKKHNHVG